MTDDHFPNESESDEKGRIQCGDYFRVLKGYPAYRYLLLSFFVDNLGNWFTFISCLTITDNYGGGGVVWTTIYLMIRLLPPFLFVPCLGPYTDLVDKRLGMICSSLLSSCVVLFMAGIVKNGSSLSSLQLFAIYFASLIQFTSETFYGPLRASLIPLLVEKEDLMITSTWDGFGWSTISAFGASIGGFVTSKYGFRAAFLLDALSYFTSAVLVSFVPTVTLPKADFKLDTPPLSTEEEDLGLIDPSVPILAAPISPSGPISPPSSSTKPTSLSMNKELITFLFTNPFIFFICFLRGSGSLLWGAADLLSIRFSDQDALQHYGDKEMTLGIIYAFVGIGCQVGPMLWNSLTPQKEYHLFRVIVISFGQISISYFIMMTTSHIHHLLLATFIRSIASGIIYIYGGLLIQLLVPSSIQGRIFTIERGLYTFSKLLSTVMSGVGFDYFHWDEYQMSLFMFLFSGGVTLLWSVIFISHYHLTDISGGYCCSHSLKDRGVQLRYQEVCEEEDDLEMRCRTRASVDGIETPSLSQQSSLSADGEGS
jgi:MFS family permease